MKFDLFNKKHLELRIKNLKRQLKATRTSRYDYEFLREKIREYSIKSRYLK